MVSVLIADDQALIRGGFRLIMEAQDDLEVCGEAENGREAVALTRTLDPDVVLMDVRMPVLDGVAATREIVASGSRSRVLMLTTFDADEVVYKSLAAGASGFLLKSVDVQQLAAGVRTVASGDALLAPTLTRRLIESYVRAPRVDPGRSGPLATLTEREVEVLRLIARGLTNADIAGELFLSAATVKSHVNRILTKLDLRDRVQVVVFAYENGLVRPGEHQREM